MRTPIRIAAVFALLSLAISACAGGSSPYLNTKVPPQSAFASSDKAVVVIAVEHRDRNFLIGEHKLTAELYFRRRTPFNVKAEQGKQSVAKYFFRIRSSGRAQAYAIPPGEYALVQIHLDSPRPRLRYRAAGWSPSSGRPRITGFRVAAGEIVYLGHFHCDPPDGGVPLIMGVDNEPEKARQAVQIAFPGTDGKAMVARMTTRLLKVPTSAW